MAEKLCTLRTKGGGGGKYTETSLWTNQSPSSAFSGQDVTLSESIDNFKYIAVKFKSTTTSSSDSQMATVIYKVEDIKKATSPSAALQPVSAFGNLNSGNTNYNYRYIVYKGSTTLFIANAYSINASGSNSSLAIPLEILGLNELDHGKRFDETVLWTNASPSSEQASAAKSLDTGKFSDYDFIKLVWWFNTMTSTTYSMCVPYSEFIKFATGTGTGQGAIFIGTTNSSNLHFARPIYYTNDTSFQIGTCYQAGSSTTANTRAILVNIIGCKFR